MFYLISVSFAAVFGAFIAPIAVAYKAKKTGAKAAPPSAHLAPVIRNSCIAYGTGLAGLVCFLTAGIAGKLWLVVAYLFLTGFGLNLLYLLRHQLLGFIEASLVRDRSTTLHEFIAVRHGNDPRVRAFAAGLTVFVICGLIVGYMVALAIALKPMLWSNGQLAQLIVGAIFMVVVACTLLSGKLEILHAFQLQLGLLYFGLFASTVLILYLQVSALGALPGHGVAALVLIAIISLTVQLRRRGRYVDTSPIGPDAENIASVSGGKPAGRRPSSRLKKIFNSIIGVESIVLIVLATMVASMSFLLQGVQVLGREGIEALRAGTSASLMTLLSFAVLGFLRPILDAINWQSIAALTRVRHASYFNEGDWKAAFKRFSLDYAVEVPLLGLFIFLFGALAGLSLLQAQENPTQLFVKYLLTQDNAVATTALCVLMMSFLALAVATIGSLLSAGLDVISCDIIPAVRPKWASTSRRPADASKPTRSALIGALVIAVSALVSFLAAGPRFDRQVLAATLVGVIFSVGSVQIALAPLVLAPLIAGRSRFATVSAAGALAVLSIGAATGIVMSIAGLFGYEPAFSLAVPSSLAAAALVFLIAAAVRRQSGASAFSL